MELKDLAVEAFIVLRNELIDENGKPKQFWLREKRNTQDDPFDEYIHSLLKENLENINCTKAPGPLITPDIVLWRPSLINKVSDKTEIKDERLILGIEIKKLERRSGKVARPTGIDYNTTPPCGIIRIYDKNDNPIDIRGYYLFACLEKDDLAQKYQVTALVLCDGNLLNQDFDLYLRAIGRREKEIGLGTYGNGANRNRPMFIFSNPLGVQELDYSVSLIHANSNLEHYYPNLKLVYKITRTAKSGETFTFYCYRIKTDVPKNWEVKELKDPFPIPARARKTQSRGRFRLPIELGGFK